MLVRHLDAEQVLGLHVTTGRSPRERQTTRQNLVLVRLPMRDDTTTTIKTPCYAIGILTWPMKMYTPEPVMNPVSTEGLT